MPKGQPRSPHKQQFWQTHVARWQASGLSVRDYCASHHLAEPSFYSWRRLLAQRAADVPVAATTATVTFVPLHVQPEEVAASVVLEVVLTNGRRLRVPAGFDAITLRTLLALLEDTSC